MVYQRAITQKLESELETKEIVVLTGMRQVGKTTLLKYLFSKVSSENKVFLDLGNPLSRKIFEEEDYNNIWENLTESNVSKNSKAYIFLDEIQNMPKVIPAVKYLFDHYEVKFFLTGSSSYYLKNLFGESMAGRKVVFELFPLSFHEFLSFKNVDRSRSLPFAEMTKQKNYVSYQKLLPYYKEFLEYGGFPRVVLENNIERKGILLEEIFTSYFELDVKSLADFKDISKLRDLILLLTSRIGSKIDVAKLSSELGVARETIYSYLEFLQKTYFLTLLGKHTGSLDRKVAGGKKVYFCDGGLANKLAKVSWGQLFEQSVFTCLRPFCNLSFYDREGASEIDFVINGRIGLEVKTFAGKRDLINLSNRAFSAGLEESFVVTYEYCKGSRTILSTNL